MLHLLKGLFSGTVYIQIWEERIRIALVGSGNVFDERPYIALANTHSKTPIVRAIGDEAYKLRGSSEFEVSNPFSHPRLLINGFQKAEKVLQHGIKAVCKNKLFPPSPIVVMHPMEKLEGGITDVECRMFRELALGGGARAVYLHIGQELSSESLDISQVKAPEAEQQLRRIR